MDKNVVAFLIVRNDQFLAEQKNGEMAIPAGKIEANEKPFETLEREIFEELNIKPIKYHFLRTLQHSLDFPIIIHYFVVSEWEGEIECKEAESVEWVSLNQEDKLHLKVDRIALEEYKKLKTNP